MLTTAARVGAFLSAVALLLSGCAPAASPVESVQPLQARQQAALRRLSPFEYRNVLRDTFGELPHLHRLSVPLLDGYSNDIRGQHASELEVRKTLENAQLLVRALGPRIGELAGCSPSWACAKDFVQRYGLKLYRRPLSDDEEREFLMLFEMPGSEAGFTLGVQLTLMTMLQSPWFLYRPEVLGPSDHGGLDSYERAARLSFLLWGSGPDEVLLAAAERDELSSASKVLGQVDRMLADERSSRGLGQFFVEWWRLDKLHHSRQLKGQELSEAVRQEMINNLADFGVRRLLEPKARASDLMNSADYGSSPAVSRVVSTPVPQAKKDRRLGLLGHPTFLAAHSYARYPSPVLRGAFILDRLLCAPSPPPPPTQRVRPESNRNDVNAVTNREAYIKSTSGPGCRRCHRRINPLGFALENFDSIGRFRATDAGRPVDASGRAMGMSFGGPGELAEAIAVNPSFNRCLVKNWLQFATGGQADQNLEEEVESSFANDGLRLRELVKGTATHPAIMGQLAQH